MKRTKLSFQRIMISSFAFFLALGLVQCNTQDLNLYIQRNSWSNYMNFNAITMLQGSQNCPSFSVNSIDTINYQISASSPNLVLSAIQSGQINGPIGTISVTTDFLSWPVYRQMMYHPVINNQYYGNNNTDGSSVLTLQSVVANNVQLLNIGDPNTYAFTLTMNYQFSYSGTICLFSTSAAIQKVQITSSFTSSISYHSHLAYSFSFDVGIPISNPNTPFRSGFNQTFLSLALADYFEGQYSSQNFYKVVQIQGIHGQMNQPYVVYRIYLKAWERSSSAFGSGFFGLDVFHAFPQSIDLWSSYSNDQTAKIPLDPASATIMINPILQVQNTSSTVLMASNQYIPNLQVTQMAVDTEDWWIRNYAQNQALMGNLFEENIIDVPASNQHPFCTHIRINISSQTVSCKLPFTSGLQNDLDYTQSYINLGINPQIFLNPVASIKGQTFCSSNCGIQTSMSAHPVIEDVTYNTTTEILVFTVSLSFNLTIPSQQSTDPAVIALNQYLTQVGRDWSSVNNAALFEYSKTVEAIVRLSNYSTCNEKKTFNNFKFTLLQTRAGNNDSNVVGNVSEGLRMNIVNNFMFKCSEVDIQPISNTTTQGYELSIQSNQHSTFTALALQGINTERQNYLFPPTLAMFNITNITSTQMTTDQPVSITNVMFNYQNKAAFFCFIVSVLLSAMVVYHYWKIRAGWKVIILALAVSCALTFTQPFVYICVIIAIYAYRGLSSTAPNFTNDYNQPLLS